MVRSAQRNSDAEITNLRAEIQNLLSAKAQLESSIANLKVENDSLRNRANVLEQDLNVARQNNTSLSQLNRTMEGELKRLTLANFKATAFRVEVEKKRKSKLTSKSRQAKKVVISFDVTEVPDQYQGVRPLYLVISDETGTPIKAKNPVNAQVTVNSQRMDIIAVEAKEIDITSNQRLSFTHDLEEKLRKGFYRILIYTDIGLLGSNSFRLR